jgi:acylphosphatase
VRRHWRIYGGVQGVGFRIFAVRAARRLSIAGYARNLRDGSVQVEAEGDPASLNEFREVLRGGPPAALVTRIEEREPGGTSLPEPFGVLHEGAGI